MSVAADYIQPGQRANAWADMAAELHRDGRSVPQIARSLCVDESTVIRLLRIARCTA